MVLEVVEGLNESFIRSTEKGERRENERERERGRDTEQQEGEEEEEEVVQRGRQLIFLAHPQKQEVGREEPRGTRPVSSGETGVRFGIDPGPPPACPQADRVGLQISLMKPLASSPQAGLQELQKMSSNDFLLLLLLFSAQNHQLALYFFLGGGGLGDSHIHSSPLNRLVCSIKLHELICVKESD